MKRRTFLVGGAVLATGMAGMSASFARSAGLRTYADAMEKLRAPAHAQGDVRELVRFATLAANGHNAQPWRFRIGDRAIHILPDLSRRTPAVDPDDHHLYVSLGCAAENLALAAAASGRIGEPRFESGGDGTIVFDHARGKPRPSALADAIPRRQTTRAAYDGRPATAAELATLERAAAMPGVDMVLLTDRPRMGMLRDLVVTGNDRQMADRAFMAELRGWMRFDPRVALEYGDGLFSAASGNPVLPSWLGFPLFDLAFTARSENDKYALHIASSAGAAVFFGSRDDPAHWVTVGRACQRFALQATALGLKVAFVNQPVEVPGLRAELAALAGLAGRRPDLVIRFGRGPELPMSPRRPVDAVIEA